MAELKRQNSGGSEGSETNSVGSAASGASGVSGCSDGSTGSTSSAVEAAKDGDAGQQHEEEDDIDDSQSILKGIFGVLFTLSKEKVDSSKRFVIVKLILEFIQLLFLVAAPSYGWTINEDVWIWKVVAYINYINPIIIQGYGFYLGIMYTVSVFLLISVGLCVWVGYCFQKQRFPVVWPIQVLRLFVSIFFVAFYIASLTVFLVALSCNWFSGAPYTMAAFPDVQCLTMPHIVHMVVAGIMIVLFVTITVSATAADFEQNPISNRWLAMASSSVEVRALVARTVATLAFSLLRDLRKPQTLLIALALFYALWSFLRWEPHMFEWMNHVRAGLYGSLSYAAFNLLILVFSGDRVNTDPTFSDRMTLAMLAGLGPAWIFCMLVSFVRFRWQFNAVYRAFITAPPEMKARDVWRWRDWQTVELCSRVCRTVDADDDEKQDEFSIKLAERMLKGGMSFFSSKAEMCILYANFMIEVTGATQAGAGQLAAAKNTTPSLVQRFAIFVREQVHMQATQTQASGENSTDLVAYVEFQKHQRLLTRSHRAALIATRNFWRLLANNEVQFSALSECFHDIEQSHAKADKAYKTVLERYGSSAKILHMYADFLSEVKCDPWGAVSYLQKSEQLEEEQAAAESSALLAGGTGSDMRDARNSPVCIINARGTFQMTNKLLLQLFGYRRGELDGKNVSVLMPQPFSGRHNTYLRNYLTTGKAKIMGAVREVLGLHRDGYVFPARILVSKISGDGMDSVFMGVFKPVEVDQDLVRVYATPGGVVLCADACFADWFGRSPADVQGKLFHTVGVEQVLLEHLVAAAAETCEEDLNQGKVSAMGCHLLHKYAEPVKCNVVLQLGGTETQRVLIYNIRRLTFNDLMIATDPRGKVVYTTSKMAELLSFPSAHKMLGLPIQRLIAQPYSQLHTKFLRKHDLHINTGSCRGNFVVPLCNARGATVPVRCKISEKQLDGKSLFVVEAEPSCFDEGLKQTCLKLCLDSDRPGIVNVILPDKVSAFGAVQHEIPADRDRRHAAWLSSAGAFGTRQKLYHGRHISSFIDVFKAARDKEGGTIVSCTQLLKEMIEISRVKPGMAYRVGVHPPVDESKLANPDIGESTRVAADGTTVNVRLMEHQMLQRETKPGILTMEIKRVGAGDNVKEEVFLYVYNATALNGVVEINKAGIIVKPACCKMHMTGPIFGVSTRSMNQQSIRKFLQLPAGISSRKQQIIRALMESDGVAKKGALKNSFNPSAMGALKVMDATHSDGQPLEVALECMARENRVPGTESQQRYVMRIRLHNPGMGATDFPALVSALRTKTLSSQAIQTVGVDEEDDDGSEESNDELKAKGHAGNIAIRSSVNLPMDGARKSDTGNDEGMTLPGQAPPRSRQRAAFAIEGIAPGDEDAPPRPMKLAGKPVQRPGSRSDNNVNLDGSSTDNSASETSSAEIKKASVQGTRTVEADFQRGQRAARLLALMTAPDAFTVVAKFQRHSICLSIVLLAVHIGCFIAVYQSAYKQMDVVNELETAGLGSTYLHDVCLWARVLDNIYQGQHAGADDQSTLLYSPSTLNEVLDRMRVDTDRFEAAHHGVYLGEHELRRLQDADGHLLYTIWEKPILQVHTWVDAYQSFEETSETSMWLMGNEFVAASRELIHNADELTNGNTTALSESRYWYYIIRNGPTALFDGYAEMLTAMASRELSESKGLQQVILALMIVESVGMFLFALLYVMRLVTQLSHFRYQVYSIFLVIPSTLVRNMASKRLLIDVENDDDEEESVNKPRQAASTATAQALSFAKAIPGGKGADGKAEEDSRAFIATFRRVVLGAQSGVGLALGSKKKLLLSSWDSTSLLLPFLIWSVLMLVIYPLSYVTLDGMGAPLSHLIISSFLMVRSQRLLFYMHEACSAVGASDKAAAVAELRQSTGDLAQEWDVAEFGANRDAAASVSYYLHAHAFSHSNSHDQLFLYRNQDCIRTQDLSLNPDCYSAGAEYYASTRQGAASMIARALNEAHSVVYDSAAWVNLTSPRLDWTWRISLNDLYTALHEISTEATQLAKQTLVTVVAANIALLVLCIVLIGYFVFFMVQPYQNRARKENVRIAELLSQLPTDLEVESLVVSALAIGNNEKDPNKQESTGDKAQDADEADEPLPAGFANLKDRDGLVLRE